MIIDKEPFIIVLVGLPGSGKSTWVNENFKDGEDNVVVVSSDKWVERRAAILRVQYSFVYKDCIGWATAKMKSDAKNAIKEEKNIIWDQTNLSKKKRKGILKRINDRYYKIAINFDVPDSVLEERLEHRSKLDGKTIPRHVLENMISSYDPITKDEGFDKIIDIRN